MFQGMEYVYEVYKQKSFSKAAAKLYISQPSLSANVKRIEKKVGYPRPQHQALGAHRMRQAVYPRGASDYDRHHGIRNLYQ